jgi:hypothetical protein
MRPLLLRTVAASAVLVTGGAALATSAVRAAPAEQLDAYARTHSSAGAASLALTEVAGATPRAACGPGSMPETAAQGRVPQADYDSGRASQGYSCNAAEVGHSGVTGGFKTFSYRDTSGRLCAFYDGTLLFPTSLTKPDAPGVHVLDMTGPSKPVETARLLTVGAQTPHESLVLNEERGLLAAIGGNPASAPAAVDVYDVSKDCRTPVLASTSYTPGRMGHESGFSPDGRTLWISSGGITAIDVSDPTAPSEIFRTTDYSPHGLSFSADGNRLYAADLSGETGVIILDVSQVQARAAAPAISEISRVTWPELSIPQNTIPVTIRGRRYLVEFDEYSKSVFSYDPASPVGAARLIDISDERRPKVVSNIRLEVNQPDARAGEQKDDPGAQQGLQGYAAHYCAVPRAEDPKLLACSFILSGLRVFNIEDPQRPREVAYFNRPAPDGPPLASGAYAMSAPAFDIGTQQVWYADGNSGFWATRLTNGAWPKGLR